MKIAQTLLAVAVLLTAAGAAQAMPIVYQAALSGAAEQPPNASPGTGLATVAYDPALHTLSVAVSFSGLVGNTTAAHIHCCVDAPGTVGVATTTPTFPGFPAGVTSGTYNQLFDLMLASSFSSSFITASGGGIADAELALANGLGSGRAYFNIHTSLFAGGEIRGFLTAERAPAPEPATLSLLSLGIASLVAARRRRSI